MPAGRASPSAERLHDRDDSRVVDRRREITHRFVVDPDLHVTSQAVLFVRHAKPKAGELSVEVVEDIGHRLAVSVDHRPLIGVRPQRCRDADLHPSSTE